MVSEKSGKLTVKEAICEITELCKKCTVKCIKVHSGASNALDFCLITTVGRYIQRAPKSKHIVLSNDKGYDAVVEMLAEDGLNIVRFDGCKNVVNIRKKYKVEDLPLNLQNEWKSILCRLQNERKQVLTKEQYSKLVTTEYAKVCCKYEANMKHVEQSPKAEGKSAF